LKLRTECCHLLLERTNAQHEENDENRENAIDDKRAAALG